jgi:hypothetical protein
MNASELPIDLKKLIEGEKIDFAVKAKRDKPLKKSIGTIFIGIAMCAFMSLFVFTFLSPFFEDEEINIDRESIFPVVIICLLSLAGIFVFISGIVSLFHKGGYFVGTETRMIQYRKGKITITDWEQFTGNVKIKARKNFGDLEYELRTGKIESRKNAPDIFVPDVIYISEIENVFEIEKKCKIRIKENDPTPAVLSS